METSEMRLRIYARRQATLVLLVSLFGIGTGISIPAISAEGREAPLVAATKASDTEAVEALLAQQIDVLDELARKLCEVHLVNVHLLLLHQVKQQIHRPLEDLEFDFIIRHEERPKA